MKCYHRTTADAADLIIQAGFRDRPGRSPAAEIHRTAEIPLGEWLSDVPVDRTEGASGDVVLAIDLPEHVFRQYECAEEGKGYRESLVPAALVNQYGPPTIVPAG